MATRSRLTCCHCASNGLATAIKVNANSGESTRAKLSTPSRITRNCTSVNDQSAARNARASPHPSTSTTISAPICHSTPGSCRSDQRSEPETGKQVLSSFFIGRCVLLMARPIHCVLRPPASGLLRAMRIFSAFLCCAVQVKLKLPVITVASGVCGIDHDNLVVGILVFRLQPHRNAGSCQFRQHRRFDLGELLRIEPVSRTSTPRRCAAISVLAIFLLVNR